MAASTTEQNFHFVCNQPVFLDANFHLCKQNLRGKVNDLKMQMIFISLVKAYI